MKNLKKVFALVLCLTTILSVMTISVSAANYTSRYSNYDSPENSGDWAQYKNKKAQRSSSTTVDEVRWIQAALNYCMDAEGLNKLNGYDVSKLEVDGRFGPASQKATIAFQKAAGLNDDGSFGPATIKKMKSVLNDKKTNSLVPTKTVSRPTTTTTTTTTTTSQTTSSNTFKQQNIIQYNTTKTGNFITGSWATYKGTGKYDDTIHSSGCGIVSLVSAIYNLGGTIQKDKIRAAIIEIFDWAYGVHWKDATVRTLFLAAEKKFGTKYKFDVLETKNTYGLYGDPNNRMKENTDLSSLVNHLKNNKGTAVVYVNGHFMAAVDYKVENGIEKIHIFDPAPGELGSPKRKSCTTADGDWIAVQTLRDGKKAGKLEWSSSNSLENIEITQYWLISKK